MGVTAASFTQLDVIFEIGIGPSHFNQVLKRRRMERGSSQIGMNHHPGCIDDAAELRLSLQFYFSLEEGIEVLEGEEFIPYIGEFFLIEEFLPQPPQCLPDSLDNYVSRIGS
jgi:hypothetical protein